MEPEIPEGYCWLVVDNPASGNDVGLVPIGNLRAMILLRIGREGWNWIEHGPEYLYEKQGWWVRRKRKELLGKVKSRDPQDWMKPGCRLQFKLRRRRLLIFWRGLLVEKDEPKLATL